MLSRPRARRSRRAQRPRQDVLLGNDEKQLEQARSLTTQRGRDEHLIDAVQQVVVDDLNSPFPVTRSARFVACWPVARALPWVDLIDPGDGRPELEPHLLRLRSRLTRRPLLNLEPVGPVRVEQQREPE